MAKLSAIDTKILSFNRKYPIGTYVFIMLDTGKGRDPKPSIMIDTNKGTDLNTSVMVDTGKGSEPRPSKGMIISSARNINGKIMCNLNTIKDLINIDDIIYEDENDSEVSSKGVYYSKENNV